MWKNNPKLILLLYTSFVTYKDGLIWFGLTCLWALIIPMLAKWFIPSFQYGPWNFLSEGDIVLFSMVITSSLVIDNFLFETDFSSVLDKKHSGMDKKNLEFQKGLFIHISPMLLIVFCLITYLRCQAVKEHIDISTIIGEIFLFILVAVYAAFVKQISWEGKDKKDKEEIPSSSQLNNQS